MSGRNGPLSPVSFESNGDWSPILRYPSPLGGDAGPYPAPKNLSKGSLVTPPTSGHTSADTLHTDGGMSRPATRRPSNGNPSPPSSVARSSDGTGLYASSVSGSMDSRRQFMMEEALAEHYQVLKRYLAPHLRDQRALPQNKARDKLLRLSPIQFQELSTDVYDELRRRQDEKRAGPGSDIPQYLPPKNNFHFKRNQARQKLSTLPSERFRQLATDVFYELERRFPRFTGRPSSPAGSTMSGMSGRGPPPPLIRTPNGFGGPGPQPPPFRGPRSGSMASSDGRPNGLTPNGFGDKPLPTPKTWQSNTIVPNKSTLIEDDDDDDDVAVEDGGSLMDGPGRRASRTTNKSFGSSDKAAAEHQAQISKLEEKIDSLNSEMREKDQELDRMREANQDKEAAAGSDKEEWSRLQFELEGKLSDAQALNMNLQNELDRIEREKVDMEQDMRRQVAEAREEASRADTGPDMARQYEALQNELAEQQKLTDEVKREAFQYLTDMRNMSANTTSSFEREEQLADQVAQLEREVKDWKTRYARSKAQLRSMHASSVGLGVPPLDVAGVAQNSAVTDPLGLVKDVHLTRFQISIDELLQAARRTNANAILEPMKAVVANVRYITSGIEDLPRDSPLSEKPSEDGSANPMKQQARLKSRISATANNLITASKNHAAASGLSPVSLVDAAASHLTTAIIELVKLVKIRPTPADELAEDDLSPAPLNSAELSLRKIHSGLGLNGITRRTHSGQLSRSSVNSLGYSGTSSPRRGEVLSSRTSDDSPLGPPPSAGLNRSPTLPLPLNVAAGGLRADDELASAPPGGADLDEYKTYLEDQTALLVQNIQPLVNGIRSAARGGNGDDDQRIASYVAEISRAILDIGDKTRETIADSGNMALERHGPPVIDALEECRVTLVSRQERGEKGGMPPVAFRIARATKELVLRVDRIESGELTADMACPLEM